MAKSFARSTKQRTAILELFEDAHAPLSPDQVLKRAGKKVPGIGIATVYRTLNSLVTDGLLELVDVPGETARYEAAGKHHHHHFLCRKCSSMFEVEGCLGNLKTLVPKGFKMEEHHLTLFGLCKDCK